MQREKLLLIPGPSPVHPRIIKSLSTPTISHISPDFVFEFKKALNNLRKIVFSSRGEPFIISGAGTLSMEMALINMVKEGEKILVVSQGFFGERMAGISQCFGIECHVIESNPGEAVLPEELKDRLSNDKYAAVVSTHVDTCTGACAPVMEYAEIVKETDALFIIDGVCATGGIKEKMDEWDIDVILTAAQKCFGAPPGLAVLVLSEKSMNKRRSMERIPAYYSDVLNWLPVMKDPFKYFSTPCVNEIRAFYEGTEIMLEEGMEQRFMRHSRSAYAIREAFIQLGFSFYTKEPFLADTLTVVEYPEGIDDKKFRAAYLENGVVVAGGLAETSGKVFRMGHMGNLSNPQILFAIEMLEKTLSTLGHKFQEGSGLKAAQSVLDE